MLDLHWNMLVHHGTLTENTIEYTCLSMFRDGLLVFVIKTYPREKGCLPSIKLFTLANITAREANSKAMHALQNT